MIFWRRWTFVQLTSFQRDDLSFRSSAFGMGVADPISLSSAAHRFCRSASILSALDCVMASTRRRAARVRGASARRRASRRLAGDGVYWDRLRVGGRVWGATCAAPRKNRRRHSRPVEPPPQAITTRDAPPSAGPPPQHGGSRRRARRPAQRPAADEQAAKKHGCVHQRSCAATRPRAAAKRADRMASL